MTRGWAGPPDQQTPRVEKLPFNVRCRTDVTLKIAERGIVVRESILPQGSLQPNNQEHKTRKQVNIQKSGFGEE